MMTSTIGLLAATLFLFSLWNAAVTTAVENDEVESMLNVLRASGYNLFSNAIATSDLIYDVLSGKTFTFFAPTDASLFAIDMINSATDYTATLRCHVIPIRMSLAELRRFPSGSVFPTLSYNHQATLRIPRRHSDENITVDGVPVAFPGLFYSRKLAVHGLGGIMDCRSHQESPPLVNQTSPSPTNSHVNHRHPNHRHSPPSTHKNFTGNTTSQSPIANSPGDHSFVSLGNVSDNHSFDSAVVGESQSPAPTLNLSDHVEPLSSGEIRDRTIISPEPELPAFGGFSPAVYSPAPVNLPTHVSPACHLWPQFPTCAILTRTTKSPPPPEFSENDDPVAFPPSNFNNLENDAGDMLATESELTSLSEKDLASILDEERKIEQSEHITVISLEDLEGIMETVPEKFGPSEGKTFDCQGYAGQVSFPRGFVYTRQPTTTPTTSNLFCTSV